jgi:hypothetical protein
MKVGKEIYGRKKEEMSKRISNDTSKNSCGSRLCLLQH